MIQHLSGFADQCRQACRLAQDARWSTRWGRGLRHIVFAGLGGSAIGGDLVASFLRNQARVPVSVIRHYRLPAWVDRQCLVICSSYSGQTEETLEAAREAARRKVPCMVMASGGALLGMARRRGWPSVQVPAGYPPRAAVGFAFFIPLVILSRLGYCRVAGGDIREMMDLLGQRVLRDEALRIARAVKGRLPVVYGDEELLGAVALRWRTQLEENAKILASHHVYPELCHNELVGWSGQSKARVTVLCLRWNGEHRRVALRYRFTESVYRRAGARVLTVRSRGASRLAQQWTLIHLGDWVSYHLAMLRGVDPTPVKVIDRLKAYLKSVKSARPD